GVADDHPRARRCGEHARVTDLATLLAVERRLVEHHLHGLAVARLVDGRAVDDDPAHDRITLVAGVADELRAPRSREGGERTPERRPGVVLDRGARTFLLRLHLRAEPVLVDAV